MAGSPGKESMKAAMPLQETPDAYVVHADHDFRVLAVRQLAGDDEFAALLECKNHRVWVMINDEAAAHPEIQPLLKSCDSSMAPVFSPDLADDKLNFCTAQLCCGRPGELLHCSEPDCDAAGRLGVRARGAATGPAL